MSDVTFTINVELDDETLKQVQGGQSNLCFVRDVNSGGTVEKGNVVFASIHNKDLSTSMKISYQDAYKVFETRPLGLAPGMQVGSDTDICKILPGETATFLSDKVEVNGESDATKPIAVVNQWILGARAGALGFNPDTQTYSIFYLSRAIIIKGKTEFTPLKSFGVFWAERVGTNTLIDKDRSYIYHFELKGSSITLKYQNKTWSIKA